MKTPSRDPVYIGQRFGKLIVQSRSTTPRYWSCLCVCGKTKDIRADSLQQERTQSCGCSRITHGGTVGGPNPTYRSWRSMISRCTNRNDKSYKGYGGRGIKVHPAWLDFSVFHRDLGSRPRRKTLDRRDVNGHYTPANCMWSTAAEQADNRRSTLRLTCNRVSRTHSEWADILAKRTGKKWSVKSLRYILNFLNLDQIMGSTHPAQRTATELESEQASREARARWDSEAAERVQRREEQAKRDKVNANVPQLPQVQPLFIPPMSSRHRHVAD